MAATNSVPRVKEVALRSGVSEATVSRVLNGNYKHGFSVRKEVRQRITEVADALGYRPNLAAKNLVKRQTKMVAVLGSNIVLGWPGNIYQAIVNALVQVLRARGFDVCITVPNLEKDDTELPNWRVDGVIVLQESSDKTIEQMEKTRLPYVVINGIGGSRCSSVIPDDIEATHRAVRYLVDIGHRRIAYAGPTLSHKKHRSIDDRHNTYLSALAESKLESIPGHDTAFRSACAFLNSAVVKNGATAILAYDHVEALKILHGAHVLNIQIPKQVSLMCFNDDYLCKIVTPSLTSIGISLKQIGRIAAERLLKHIESPKENPECIKLTQDLIIRDSTAPPMN